LKATKLLNFCWASIVPPHRYVRFGPVALSTEQWYASPTV